MLESTLNIFINIIILGLFLVTIWFCMRLQKQIKEMQGNKSEMIDIIKSLDASVVSTHKNLAALKEASINANNEVKMCIEKGNEIANEMSFMIETGNKLSNKLEKLINDGKQINALPAKKSVKKVSKTKKAN